MRILDPKLSSHTRFNDFLHRGTVRLASPNSLRSFHLEDNCVLITEMKIYEIIYFLVRIMAVDFMTHSVMKIIISFHAESEKSNWEC